MSHPVQYAAEKLECLLKKHVGETVSIFTIDGNETIGRVIKVTADLAVLGDPEVYSSFLSCPRDAFNVSWLPLAYITQVGFGQEEFVWDPTNARIRAIKSVITEAVQAARQ